jgi:hypothetical protein
MLHSSIALALLLLACLPGTARAQIPVFELHGSAPGDNYSKRLVRSADLNGDGTQDLLVSAPHSNEGGSNSGSVHVLSGADGSPLYIVPGLAGSEFYGEALDAIADVDGDGVDDWVVGAPFASSGMVRNGRVELRSGTDGSLILSTIGIEQFGTLGAAVAGLGDLDGDLLPDFIMSAPLEDSNGQDAGSIYVVSGANGGIIRTHFGSAAQVALGTTLEGCGDVDGDGVDDYAAGTPAANAGLGTIQIWSGQSGALIQSFNGSSLTGTIGNQIASVVDMNGDGRRDLAIGAPGDSTSGAATGAVYVYSCQSGVLIHSVLGQGPEVLGLAVADAGDWNGDGQGDWLAGRHDASLQGGAYVLSGIDGSQLAELLPSAHNDLLGSVFAGGFDLNGDGLAEFASGDPLANAMGNDSGSVLMISSLNLLGTPLCFGDASGANCPCGNFGSSGNGCSNSTGEGANLQASGSARVFKDDLQLFSTHSAAGVPALLFAGPNTQNNGSGVIFGDGLLCVGGQIRRLGVRFCDSNGAANWGPGIIRSEGWSAGITRVFQVWYRDSSGTPCGSEFNLSNGLSIHFLP